MHNFICKHIQQVDKANSTLFNDLVLVTLGNKLRSDDGIAQTICNLLPPALLDNICRFDLEIYSSLLRDCLNGHGAAIIVDATKYGAEPGKTTILDLNELLCFSTDEQINGSHTLSFFDELKILKQQFRLPSQLKFFGIEIINSDFGDAISPLLNKQIPKITEKLVQLINAEQLEVEMYA